MFDNTKHAVQMTEGFLHHRDMDGFRADVFAPQTNEMNFWPIAVLTNKFKHGLKKLKHGLHSFEETGSSLKQIDK